MSIANCFADFRSGPSVGLPAAHAPRRDSGFPAPLSTRPTAPASSPR